MPSKIYALCYLEKHSGYSLAKIVYDVKEGIPRTGKIYSAITQMIKQGYISRNDENIYVAEIKPLAREIQKIFDRFGIINYNEPPRHLKNKVMTNEELGRNRQQDSFELHVLEELLSSDLIKTVLRSKLNHKLIRQNGGNFLLELTRLLTETSVFLEEQFDLSRTQDPKDIYVKMNKGKFKSEIKYKPNLVLYRYFSMWKNIVEKQEINLEGNLDVDFPEMELLWNTSKQRYDENKLDFENDSWVIGYTQNVHYTMLMWLVPFLLINKFRRLKWEILVPDWSRIILGNPNEDRTEAHGYFLK